MDLVDFKRWALREFGIDLFAYKENQLHRRILSLISRVGAKSIDDYVEMLKKDENQRQKFLDFITINVTEFFRNPEIFKEFEKELKNMTLKNSHIKIWSAACSIGAEPYSIAIIIDKLGFNNKCNIIATDIDTTILGKAKNGEYIESEIKNIEKQDLHKYFRNVGDKYIIGGNIKNMITYKRHDLILDSYENDFDIIVCRNVVIYFNQDIKEKIYKKFSNALKKGGLLFVGATESIYNYKEYGFEKASTFIYRKL